MQVEIWFAKKKDFLFFKRKAHAITLRDIGYIYIACTSMTRYRTENYIKVDDNYEHKCDECLKIVLDIVRKKLHNQVNLEDQYYGGALIRR